VSHGILQHAVTGRVPLQLAYTKPEAGSHDPQTVHDDFQNHLNQPLDDEFACLLQLI
jgi:hypothetical protein